MEYLVTNAVPHRSEEQMMSMIIGYAQQDDRIRAVLMNGSRVNPNAPRDIFQDYDIIYVVHSTNLFRNNIHWVDVFGERVMMQMPEQQSLLPPYGDRHITYLMLFTDGNRMDLSLYTVEQSKQIAREDSLTRLLLDKDALFTDIPPASDQSYWITKPTAQHYADCCNEFWWILQNAAKGICRDELPYTKRMLELNRDMLDQMLSWWIGCHHDFEISCGKFGKYFKRYLPDTYWQLYVQTYADSRYESIWAAMFTSCELFRLAARYVASHMDFAYYEQDDARMFAYLQQVHSEYTQSLLLRPE